MHCVALSDLNLNGTLGVLCICVVNLTVDNIEVITLTEHTSRRRRNLPSTTKELVHPLLFSVLLKYRTLQSEISHLSRRVKGTIGITSNPSRTSLCQFSITFRIFYFSFHLWSAYVKCERLPLRTPGSIPFWDLLMSQLLKSVFPYLPCLFSSFNLEYPLDIIHVAPLNTERILTELDMKQKRNFLHQVCVLGADHRPVGSNKKVRGPNF